MSPILVRPVREQLEHDRVIRLLQVKLKRKHEVIANIGEDQSTSVKIGQLQIFPDLVLTSADRARKLLGTVEVETSESVNHLEARSQWAHLGRARAPFHLYVPLGSVDIARRLANENQVNVSEIWSFHTIGDQTHFRLVHRAPEDTRRSNEPRGIVTTVPGRGDVPALPARPAAAGQNRRSSSASPRQKAGGCRAVCQGSQAGEEACGAAGPQGQIGVGLTQCGLVSQVSSGSFAEKEVSPAVSAVQSRQARLREHLCRRERSPARALADACALLVPHTTRREGRSRGA